MGLQDVVEETVGEVMAMSQVIRETMESYQEAAVKALTVAENEAARDVDKVVGAYTRLYRRGYADGYADAKHGNPSHVVDTEAAAIGESISLFRTDTERLDALLEFHREFFSGPNKIDRASLDRWMEAQDAAMSADAGTEGG